MFGVGGAGSYMTPDQYNQMLMQALNGGYGNAFGMQNYNTQTKQNTQAMSAVLRGRPVSGIEEARASMIDLDGSTFIFPDVANKMIYTKQINMQGNPEFKTYRLVEEQKQETVSEPVPAQSNKEYVLASDFEDIMSKVIKRIKRLEGAEDVTISSEDGATNGKK